MTLPGAGLDGIDVLAAGALLWRAATAGPELAVVHRARYDDWSFPKGKLKRHGAEPMPVAAVREVTEETGLGCRLGGRLADVRYPVPEGNKLVRYWTAQALAGGRFEPNRETDELRWLAPDAAPGLLSYPHDRDLVRRFTEVAPPDAVLLLVRHGKAGSRQDWDDEDSLRPLSESGREQAQKLAELLPLFGPERLCCAPPLRCRETLAPLADRLGLAVTDEPLLGESGYWADPAAALARLRELAGRPGVTVVGSQGGVIPDLVSALVTGHPIPGVDPDDVPARKASTWVLTFRGGTLRSADYYPEPTGG